MRNAVVGDKFSGSSAVQHLLTEGRDNSGADFNAIKSAGEFRAMTLPQHKHFKRIVRQSVARYCSQYLDRVEEISQEVWLRLCRWLDAGRYDSEKSRLGTLVYIFTRNYCHDFVREARPSKMSYDALDPEGRSFSATQENLDAGEFLGACIKALEKLPSDQRRVFQLHLFADVPLTVIAVDGGHSIPKIKSRYWRACQALRYYLQSFAPDS
jgi:RNA polymerase sigma factor (sigma-70 family)